MKKKRPVGKAVGLLFGRTSLANQGKKRPGSSSTYLGVSKVNLPDHTAEWRARLAGKTLGYFKTEIEAAKAYDVAAREIYGPTAKTNF